MSIGSRQLYRASNPVGGRRLTGDFERYGLWLLKNSNLVKTAKNSGIENVPKKKNVVYRPS
jgi:hypothetical protein